VFVQENENWIKKHTLKNVTFNEVFEIELPFNLLEVKSGEYINFFIDIFKNSYLIDRVPIIGFIKIRIPPPDFDRLMWL